MGLEINQQVGMFFDPKTSAKGIDDNENKSVSLSEISSIIKKANPEIGKSAEDALLQEITDTLGIKEENTPIAEIEEKITAYVDKPANERNPKVDTFLAKAMENGFAKLDKFMTTLKKETTQDSVTGEYLFKYKSPVLKDHTAFTKTFRLVPEFDGEPIRKDPSILMKERVLEMINQDAEVIKEQIKSFLDENILSKEDIEGIIAHIESLDLPEEEQQKLINLIQSVLDEKKSSSEIDTTGLKGEFKYGSFDSFSSKFKGTVYTDEKPYQVESSIEIEDRTIKNAIPTFDD